MHFPPKQKHETSHYEPVQSAGSVPSLPPSRSEHRCMREQESKEHYFGSTITWLRFGVSPTLMCFTIFFVAQSTTQTLFAPRTLM